MKIAKNGAKKKNILQIITQNLPKEAIYWQYYLLKPKLGYTDAQILKTDFQPKRLDYRALNQKLVTQWVDSKTRKKFVRDVGTAAFFKYGILMSDSEKRKLEDQVRSEVDWELVESIEGYMEVICDLGGRKVSSEEGNRLFGMFKEFNNTLVEKYPEAVAEVQRMQEDAARKAQDALETAKNDENGQNRKNRRKTKKLKRREKIAENLTPRPFIELRSIPLPTLILLYTCLSKSRFWPILLKSPAIGKSGSTDFLSAWFRGFAHYNSIPTYTDIFVMDLKSIRSLRRKIFEFGPQQGLLGTQNTTIALNEAKRSSQNRFEALQYQKSLRNKNPQNRQISAIFEEARHNNTEIVRQLLLKGFDVDSKDGSDRHKTLLHIAAENKNLAMIRMLRRFKPDPNARNRYLQTPLFLAVSGDHPEVIKELISMGADVNARDRMNGTCLYLAIVGASLDTLRALVDGGADLNVRNVNGRTPLIKACYLDRFEVVEWLLGFEGVVERINDQDEKGRSALHAACWGPKGGREFKRMNGHIMYDSPRALEMVLDAGADVRYTSNELIEGRFTRSISQIIHFCAHFLTIFFPQIFEFIELFR